MGLLNKIFRKTSNPKVVNLKEYKHRKRIEALLDLEYMPREEWQHKYKRYLKKKDYRI